MTATVYYAVVILLGVLNVALAGVAYAQRAKQIRGNRLGEQQVQLAESRNELAESRLRRLDEDSRSHFDPHQLVVGERPSRQNCSNTPARAHSWKRQCAELDEQIPVAFSAFHCIRVRNTKGIAFMASRSGRADYDSPADATGTSDLYALARERVASTSAGEPVPVDLRQLAELVSASIATVIGPHSAV